MSLDPIQLDYRRLREREERQERFISWGIVAIMLGVSTLAGLGLAAFLYYVNHP